MQAELSKSNTDNQWLLRYLKDNDWWIKTVHALTIVNNLGLKREHHAYYQDVYVWLPDVWWSEDTGVSHMSCCPNCKINKRVRAHAFQDNHFWKGGGEFNRYLLYSELKVHLSYMPRGSSTYKASS